MTASTEGAGRAPTTALRKMSDAQQRFVPYRRPPAGAPNVVVVVLDDVGFAQLGCFGSPIATPHIDALARRGLRYNRFHVTSICSSTRAALLSGRNHHAVGMGMTMETPMGFPGYTGRIPRSAALLPRILRDNGYNTMAVGKWHLCPRGEYSAAGPMERWPVAQGFQRYYGFLGAETTQWDPPLVRDNSFVDPPRSPAEGYHLSEDLADQAIAMVLDQQQAAPDKPFFLYLAMGAAHAPHQVPAEWSDPYRGAFDDGWEALRDAVFHRQRAEGVIPETTTLTPRPAWIQDWAGLSADERRLFARYMEVFAGFVTHADAQIGRLTELLARRGILDDTLLLVLSDNGASSEGSAVGTVNEPHAWLGQVEGTAHALRHLDDLGGHRAFNHYPWGWAWAGNTPLQLWKRYAWLGGVRTPLVVHWPGHTTGDGGFRSQFCHALDLFSTVLDVARVDPPETVDGVTQQPIDGASIAGTFEDPDAPSPRRTQYFEMHGSRALYHDGWKATTDYVSPLFNERASIAGSQDFDTDHWALFDLETDFAEANDLSAQHPDRVQALQELWWAEAGRNQVLPLWDGGPSGTTIHPGEYPPPHEAVYMTGGSGICEAQLPALMGGFRAVAEIDVPPEGPVEGVLCALGDCNDGWAFYIVDGRPAACLISLGHATTVTGTERLPHGRQRVCLGMAPGAGGVTGLSLQVGDGPVSAADHPGPILFLGLATAGARILVGRDGGLPFTDAYEPPFPLSIPLHRLVITSGRPGAARSTAEAVDTASRGD